MGLPVPEGELVRLAPVDTMVSPTGRVDEREGGVEGRVEAVERIGDDDDLELDPGGDELGPGRLDHGCAHGALPMSVVVSVSVSHCW